MMCAYRALACSFFDKVRRIGTPRYEPTDDDVLRAWETSVGIRETAVAAGDMACVFCVSWCFYVFVDCLGDAG